MNSFMLKTSIILGEHSCSKYNYSKYQNVLIVTDKIMIQIGLIDIITARLKQQNISYTIFDEVEPNPSFETVHKGVLVLLTNTVDVIIAVGGGSVIDAAKGFIYYGEIVQAERKKPFLKPDLIAVPTTSGAGSEVTAYAVITDTQKQIKIPIVSDSIIPNIAILDSIFTKTCPPKVTAESGIDVLTHVLESYVAVNATNFTDALCEKVTPMIFENLPVTFSNGTNLYARMQVHEASCMAGIAFTNSGLGLNHALSHSLGGRFNIPHGRANALCISHVINFNKQTMADKYANLAKILELPSSSVEEACLSLIIAIEVLSNFIQLERSVLDFGISKDEYLKAIPEMAQAAYIDPCLKTNPIQVSIPDIQKIYEALL